MRTLLYISHANVVADPAIPVPRWSLSFTGRERHAAFGRSAVAGSVTKVFCSDETKAIEAARATFPALTSELVVVPDMHENDRTATGFLPPDEFEKTADRFFAEPRASVRGWERAVDAQRRIVAALERIIDDTAEHGHVAVVGHGGVGTLLFCHFAGVPIARRHDQPANGGGNVLRLSIGDRIEIRPWTAMEAFD